MDCAINKWILYVRWIYNKHSCRPNCISSFNIHPHFDWYIFSSSFFFNSGAFLIMIEKISHYSSFSHPNHPNVSLWNFSYRKGWADANDDAILHCNCTVHVLRVRSFRSTMQGGWACHFRYDAARTHLQDNEIIDCIWMPSGMLQWFQMSQLQLRHFRGSMWTKQPD